MAATGPPSRSGPSSRLLALGAGGALLAAVIVVVVVVLSAGSSAKPARLPALSHHGDFETIFTEGSAIITDPAAEIAQLHALGVDRVRVSFTWGQIAPDATSPTPPRGFDASNPAAYPASRWAVFDTIVRDLAAHHMGLDLTLAPPPPRWAEGRGAPKPAEHPYWEPDVHDFEQFVIAVGTRYSGHYTPAGASRPLPRAAFWSLWNEPNSGVQLAPQTLDGPRLEVAPRNYRALADAAWTALRRTGHAHDTTLIGDLAPVGQTFGGRPGLFSVMTPLRFLRALYCVGSTYQPLRGTAALARGCPATAAGSARFAAQNPVLFHATAFAVHPYPFGLPPDVAVPHQPDDAVVAQLPHLFTVLDTLQRVYGSDRHYDVYDTEFGYQTTPPGTQTGLVSPGLAAKWLNWSEYLTWRMPRMLSYDQFLLADPPQVGSVYKAFASGLLTTGGARKPGWYAFQMPIWLPVSATTAHHPLEVWGGVRPAKTVAMARRAAARIQWRPTGGGAYRTIATVSTKTRESYFDVDVTFPGSGTVRVRWSPPHGPTMFSRTTAITIH